MVLAGLAAMAATVVTVEARMAALPEAVTADAEFCLIHVLSPRLC